MRNATAIYIVVATLIAHGVAADPDAPVKLKIGKATTYVDGPLRKDGLIDYVQAYEKIYGKGVTAQNNAAPLLLRAIGPAFYAEERLLGIVCKRLSVPVPPVKGDYAVSVAAFARAVWERASITDPHEVANLDAWLKAVPKEVIAEARRRYASVKEFEEAAVKRLDTLRSTPWKATDDPLIHAWLALNEKPMALIKEASRRDRYFLPAPHEPDETVLHGMLLPNMRRVRVVARALCCRAMLRLHAGDRDGAWDDLRALYRLGALMSQEPLWITNLVAASLEVFAAAPIVQLALDDGQTEARLAALLRDVSSLKPRESVLASLEIGERFHLLDSLTLARRHGVDAVVSIGIEDHEYDEPTPGQLREIDQLLDVNLVLREMNTWADLLVRSASGATFAEREKKYKELADRLQNARHRMKDLGLVPTVLPQEFGKHLVARAMLEPVEKRRAVFSQSIADLWSVILIPNIYGSYSRTDDMARTRRDLTLITIALAAHRAKHGRYPAALAELSPAYLAEIPKDRFTEKPLQYRATKNGFLLYSVGTNLKDEGGAYRTDDEEHLADIRVLVVDGKFDSAEPQ